MYVVPQNWQFCGTTKMHVTLCGLYFPTNFVTFAPPLHHLGTANTNYFDRKKVGGCLLYTCGCYLARCCLFLAILDLCPPSNFWIRSSAHLKKKFGVVPFGVVTTLSFGVMLLPRGRKCCCSCFRLKLLLLLLWWCNRRHESRSFAFSLPPLLISYDKLTSFWFPASTSKKSSFTCKGRAAAYYHVAIILVTLALLTKAMIPEMIFLVWWLHDFLCIHQRRSVQRVAKKAVQKIPLEILLFSSTHHEKENLYDPPFDLSKLLQLPYFLRCLCF